MGGIFGIVDQDNIPYETNCETQLQDIVQNFEVLDGVDNSGDDNNRN